MKKIFISLIILLISIQSAFGQNISMKEYISQLKRNIPDIRKNVLAVNNSKLDIKKAQAKGDVTLTSTGKYASTNYSSLSSFLYNGRIGSHNFQAGVSKNFLSTGTYLSLDLRQNGTYKTDNTQLQDSSLALVIKQPILLNFLGALDKYSIKDAKASLEIQKITSFEQNKEILLYYQKLYYQWIVYKQYISLTKQSFKNKQTTYNLVLRKVNARLAENDDLQKMKVNLLATEDQLKQYELSLKDIENKIIVVLGKKSFSADTAALQKEFQIQLTKKYEQKVFKTTTSHKKMQLYYKRYVLSKNYHKNKLLPELNIIGSITQKKEATDLVNSLAISDTDFYVGLEFKYAFGNSDNEASYKQSLNKIKEFKEEEKSTIQDYKKNLFTINDSIKKYRAMILINKQTIKALQSQYYTELRKYKQSRINLQYVIDTRNSILTQQIKAINLQYQLISLNLDYENLIK